MFRQGLKQALQDTFVQRYYRHLQSGIAFRKELLEAFLPWYPESAKWWRYPEVSIANCNLYPEFLHRVAQQIRHRPATVFLRSTDFGDQNPDLTEQLRSLFAEHGSDKSTTHDYYRVYSDVLARLSVKPAIRLLEIGLGTNNELLISSMGQAGRPGASLRTFRDALPNARVYGADIDRSILFHEERIRTSWVDQLDPSSFATMTTQLGEQCFDLIIDDGLHAISANLGTLLFAISHLSPEGVFMVEDIPARTLPTWEPLIDLLDADFACRFIQCRSAYIFQLQRRPASH
jgi:hypothetical protein